MCQNNYTDHSTPTPPTSTTMPALPHNVSNDTGTGKFVYTATALLQTVDIDATNIKEWAILDLGATRHFLVTDSPMNDVVPAKNALRV